MSQTVLFVILGVVVLVVALLALLGVWLLRRPRPSACDGALREPLGGKPAGSAVPPPATVDEALARQYFDLAREFTRFAAAAAEIPPSKWKPNTDPSLRAQVDAMLRDGVFLSDQLGSPKAIGSRHGSHQQPSAGPGSPTEPLASPLREEPTASTRIERESTLPAAAGAPLIITAAGLNFPPVLENGKEGGVGEEEEEEAEEASDNHSGSLRSNEFGTTVHTVGGDDINAGTISSFAATKTRAELETQLRSIQELKKKGTRGLDEAERLLHATIEEVEKRGDETVKAEEEEIDPKKQEEEEARKWELELQRLQGIQRKVDELKQQGVPEMDAACREAAMKVARHLSSRPKGADAVPHPLPTGRRQSSGSPSASPPVGRRGSAGTAIVVSHSPQATKDPIQVNNWLKVIPPSGRPDEPKWGRVSSITGDFVVLAFSDPREGERRLRKDYVRKAIREVGGDSDNHLSPPATHSGLSAAGTPRRITSFMRGAGEGASPSRRTSFRTNSPTAAHSPSPLIRMGTLASMSGGALSRQGTMTSRTGGLTTPGTIGLTPPLRGAQPPVAHLTNESLGWGLASGKTLPVGKGVQGEPDMET
eukprot:Hpha_TRINITY_DN19630_c0_g1::TRINITY_DN19630_c0_g1_i1::g.186269::m.186269